MHIIELQGFDNLNYDLKCKIMGHIIGYDLDFDPSIKVQRWHNWEKLRPRIHLSKNNLKWGAKLLKKTCQKSKNSGKIVKSDNCEESMNETHVICESSEVFCW